MLLATAGAMGLTSGPASASTAASYFALSVTPTQNLTTGEQMTVTVTRTASGTAAGLEITWVAFAWCTATFTAPDTTPRLITANVPTTSSFPTHWAGAVSATGPHAHCTTKVHPLSGDLLPQTVMAPQLNSTGDYSTVTDHLPAESSETTKLYTYTVTTRGTTTKTPPTLQCDQGHSCRFAVAVFSKQGSTPEPPIFLSVPVTYATGAELTGCNGVASDDVSSTSPGRMAQAVTDWTVGACKAGAGGGAALSVNIASDQGDGSSLEDFANGTSDMAFSAVGYKATSAFTPSTDRPYIAVPVAIDAVVLGHVQSYSQGSPSGHIVLEDFPQQLRITDAQVGQLLGGGPTRTDLLWSSPLGQALVAENPELRPTSGSGRYDSPVNAITQGAGQNANYGIVVTSLANATSTFATSFLHTLVPHALVSAKTTGKVKRISTELGVTADFGKATPPFNADSATGTNLIAKATTPGSAQPFASVDSATVASMWGGLADFAIQTPSSIGTGNPVYVAPTEASMDAATTEMIPQADGTLLPNADATSVNGVQPYPLTFVEYAIVPSQPLLTPTCTPRTASEQDLKTWLDYMTGTGQSELPAGMEPLTPALEDQAQAAISEVGVAKVTGACAAVKGASSSTAGSSGSAGTSGNGAAPTASGANGGSGAVAASTGAFGSSGSHAGGTTGGTAGSSKAPSNGKGRGQALGGRGRSRRVRSG